MPAAGALPILRAPDAGVAQLVEQSLRKREVGGSSPSTGTTVAQSFAVKLALAMVSVLGYWLIVQAAQALESSDAVPDPGLWVYYLIGVVFGALVMAPYASPTYWLPRIIALCVASALIYYLAIRFVTDGPLGYAGMTTFVIAGSGAALLVGLAVVLLAPRRFSWPLIPLTLAAGALGGAAFEFELTKDAVMLAGHWAWQMLVCAALYLSFRASST